MKSSASISEIFKPIGNILRRFNLTLFFVLIMAALGYAVLTLNSILTRSSDTTGYTSSLTVTSFDQSSIQQLNTLRPSTDPNTNASLPAGRINPFVE